MRAAAGATDCMATSTVRRQQQFSPSYRRAFLSKHQRHMHHIHCDKTDEEAVWNYALHAGLTLFVVSHIVNLVE